MSDVEQEDLAEDEELAQDDDDEAGDDEELSASAEGGSGRRELKGEASFKEMATRNIGRARKSLGNSDGEKSAMAEYLMQSALVYAILDLSDAVRSNPGSIVE